MYRKIQTLNIMKKKFYFPGQLLWNKIGGIIKLKLKLD